MNDRLKGKRILVVDDELDILEIVVENLEPAEVETSSDYEDARKKIEANTYDLVILDIMGVNGFSLLEVCHAKKQPAAMLTAHAVNVESLNQSVKLGAVSFLPKEELERLSDIVPEILEELAKGKTHWARLFKRLGPFFKENLGVLWEDEETSSKFPKAYY
jgi:DNA-binding NtrC family response regulator